MRDNNNMYIDFLLGDLEYFLIKNRDEVNKYIQGQTTLSYENSLKILERFNIGLSKANQLMKFVDTTEDYDQVKNIFILSSESLAWVLFTLPSISEQIPIFTEELNIKGQHLLDVIGNSLLHIEMLIDNPLSFKHLTSEIKEEINNISMAIGHITNMIKKGNVEN